MLLHQLSYEALIHKGLTKFQVNILQSCFLAVICILESQIFSKNSLEISIFFVNLAVAGCQSFCKAAQSLVFLVGKFLCPKKFWARILDNSPLSHTVSQFKILKGLGLHKKIIILPSCKVSKIIIYYLLSLIKESSKA